MKRARQEIRRTATVMKIAHLCCKMLDKNGAYSIYLMGLDQM